MRIVGGISYPSTWLNVYAEHMLDPCALNRKFLPGISLDSGGTSIRQSLQLRSRFLECPTWPSSASVFESRVQGVDFWVWMGVK